MLLIGKRQNLTLGERTKGMGHRQPSNSFSKTMQSSGLDKVKHVSWHPVAFVIQIWFLGQIISSSVGTQFHFPRIQVLQKMINRGRIFLSCVN